MIYIETGYPGCLQLINLANADCLSMHCYAHGDYYTLSIGTALSPVFAQYRFEIEEDNHALEAVAQEIVEALSKSILSMIEVNDNRGLNMIEYIPKELKKLGYACDGVDRV